MTLLRNHFSIVFALVIAIALVTTALFISPQTSEIVQAPRASADPVTNALLSELAKKDSDNDGIPDWEESLLGTDPLNPDTNGNGVPDGEERAALLVTKGETSEEESELDLEETWSVTDRVSRAFFRDYMSALQNGPVSESAKAALVSNAINELSKEMYENTSRFARADISVRQNSDVRSYASDLEQALREAGIFSGGTKTELELVQQAIIEGSTVPLLEVRRIGERYQAMGAAVAQVSALPGKAQMHADHANALYNVGNAILLMTNPFADPLETLVGLTLYRLALPDMTTTFSIIADEFIQNGYTPTKEEPGEMYIYIKNTRP